MEKSRITEGRKIQDGKWPDLRTWGETGKMWVFGDSTM